MHVKKKNNNDDLYSDVYLSRYVYLTSIFDSSHFKHLRD